MKRLDVSQTHRSSTTLPPPRTPLARLAGPLALAAGSLMVVVELVIFPIVDRDDHVGTSTNSMYRVSGVVYFVASCISSLRAGVFPRAICVAIVIGGLIGFQSLLPPFGIPLGLAMIWLGVWMIRTPVPAEVTEAVS